MRLSGVAGRGLALAVPLVLLAATGCGGSARDGDTITLGMDTALSGTIGALGVQNRHGVEMFLEELNAKGGVDGKKVTLVVRDDAADPATAVTNTRKLISDDKVSALFGPVSSATAVAQSALAAQRRIPVINTISNDIALTTSKFTPYTFGFVPNSNMEALAVAEYVTDNSSGGARIATIAPDYNQGHTTVELFTKRLQKSASGVEIVASYYPKLGATDFSQQIAALMAARPTMVFSVLSGNDLITFTKQAKSYGLFDRTEVIAPYGWNLLEVLKDQIPDGVTTYARAPFFAVDTPQMHDFAEKYHQRYGEWPTDWAVLGYAGAQMWAKAVEKAGSADSKAVQKALSTVQADTVLGRMSFRACDHQAPLPEYVGPLTDDLDPRYGFKVFAKATVVPAEDVMLSCDEAKSLRR